MLTSVLEHAEPITAAYTIDELRDMMFVHYDRIIDFVTSPAFRAILDEMSQIPHWARPAFVRDVLLDDAVLSSRGVVVPEGILIQRSAFGDRRPTLFAVKHFLPDGYRDIWENVNITFDNEYVDSDVSRERGVCWRAPLDPHDQAQAMTEGKSLDSIEC